MGLKDPHDPRTFTHFAKLNADGSVAAIVEVADTSLTTYHPNQDGNAYVDVTALRSPDFTVNVFDVKVDPKALIDPTDHVSLIVAFHAAMLKATPAALADKLFGPSRLDNADHVW